jgi:hypothetical protein
MPEAVAVYENHTSLTEGVAAHEAAPSVAAATFVKWNPETPLGGAGFTPSKTGVAAAQRSFAGGPAGGTIVR